MTVPVFRPGRYFRTSLRDGETAQADSHADVCSGRCAAARATARGAAARTTTRAPRTAATPKTGTSGPRTRAATKIGRQTLLCA